MNLPPKLKAIADELGPKDKEIFLGAVGTTAVPAERLSAALANLGFQVSPSSIRSYRRSLQK